MYCKHCGKEIPAGTRFCPECGASQETDVLRTAEVADTAPPKNMATWKLVSGILSLCFAMVMLFQSCSLGVAEAIGETGKSDSSIGLIVAILMIAVGIVSLAARKSRGGNIAIIVLAAIGAAFGFGLHGIYMDLIIWSAWLVILAVLALICFIRWKKN